MFSSVSGVDTVSSVACLTHPVLRRWRAEQQVTRAMCSAEHALPSRNAPSGRGGPSASVDTAPPLAGRMSAPPAAAQPHGPHGGAFSMGSVLSGRPAIFLIVTLLLFLSARSDLEQPDRQLLRQGAAGGAHAGVAGASEESKAGGVVKEQVRERCLCFVAPRRPCFVRPHTLTDSQQCVQLILELSVANERLEVRRGCGACQLWPCSSPLQHLSDARGACLTATQEQNRRLRIELLALRQAARVAGLDSLLVNSTVLGVPDETLGLATEAGLQHQDQEAESGRTAAPAGAVRATPRRHLLLRRGGGHAAQERTSNS